jgi:hypothetical protein
MIRRTLGLAAGLGLAGAAAARPPADTPAPHKSRNLVLPIAFAADKRKAIRQVQLLSSRDQGQTWEVAQAVPPDVEQFSFNAPDDGVYWLTILTVFKDGTTQPADPSKHKPDEIEKLLVDTAPPVVRVVSARRDGDEVVVEWAVDDKHPNDAATVVSFKPAGPGVVGDWQAAPADSVSRRTARFRPTVPGPVAVQVSVQDAAGNATSVVKELPAGAATTAAYTPPAPGSNPQPVPLVTPAANTQPQPGGGLGVPSLPPPALPDPTPPPAAPPGPIASVPAAPAPLPAVPAWTPTRPDAGPPPIATSGGPPPAAPGPAAAADTGSVQHVRFTQFQLQYQLDAGPSGVRHIDLYVTRDDGRTWTRWSQHDGKENPLRVNLAGRGGAAVDGPYGFKLVSVSGANISDDVPAAGTPPDVRVLVDTTPPVIRIYPLEADPASRGALVLRWQAADANLSEASPIGIEWSDTPVGPWRVVGGPDPAARVSNRGSYSWQLPPNLPTHLLYFKFTATDPAGNRSEAITPPQTVDLVRPRARIQSVVTAGVPQR